MTSSQHKKSVQLTVRGVPTRVKKLLSDRADKERKSLNTVILEILINASGTQAEEIIYRDLSALAGRWVDDPEFDAAIKAQDQIDPDMWS